MYLIAAPKNWQPGLPFNFFHVGYTIAGLSLNSVAPVYSVFFHSDPPYTPLITKHTISSNTYFWVNPDGVNDQWKLGIPSPYGDWKVSWIGAAYIRVITFCISTCLIKIQNSIFVTIITTFN